MASRRRPYPYTSQKVEAGSLSPAPCRCRGQNNSGSRRRNRAPPAVNRQKLLFRPASLVPLDAALSPGIVALRPARPIRNAIRRRYLIVGGIRDPRLERSTEKPYESKHQNDGDEDRRFQGNTDGSGHGEPQGQCKIHPNSLTTCSHDRFPPTKNRWDEARRRREIADP
jgi:hypothetical protein